MAHAKINHSLFTNRFVALDGAVDFCAGPTKPQPSILTLSLQRKARAAVAVEFSQDTYLMRELCSDHIPASEGLCYCFI